MKCINNQLILGETGTVQNVAVLEIAQDRLLLQTKRKLVDQQVVVEKQKNDGHRVETHPGVIEISSKLFHFN